MGHLKTSLALSAVLTLAWTPLVSAADDVYLPSQVRPGQKAEGLTVFVGDKVEKFELELLGVVSGFIGPKQDIVVCKLTDPKLAEAGVVAGMSGSPVYVDGKLLGALGYAMGSFMKQGICGVTPIGSMRQVGALPVERAAGPSASMGPSRGAWVSRIAELEKTEAAARSQRPTNALHSANTFDSLSGISEALVPIAAPLYVSGLDPRVWRDFQGSFERMGFVAAPGGGGGGSTAPTSTKVGLEPGGAIAAMLVRGDLSIAATGTVTTVDGNQVLAFGHPFQGGGAISYPMAQSNIITIVPSYQRSFKLGEAGKEVGALTQDRLAAIAGELGRKADVVVVDVDITTEPEGVKTKFHYELAREDQLTPQLVQMVLANSMSRRNDAGPAGTAIISNKLTFADGRTKEFEVTTSMDRDASLPVMASIMSARVFNVLWQHEFGPPSIRRLEVKAVLKSEVTTARLDAVELGQRAVYAGDQLAVKVGLRRDRQPLRFETVMLPIPEGLAPGEYDVAVGGASEANQVEIQAMGMGHPQSFDELLDTLDLFRFSGPLYVQLVGRQPSLRVGERLVGAVPLSYQTQIAPRDPDSRVTRTTTSVITEVKKTIPGAVFGGTIITLKIKARK